MKFWGFILSVIFFGIVLMYTVPVFSSTATDSTRVYGVTLDAVDHLNKIKTALSSHCRRMTARVVFDEWIPATEYITPCTQIKTVGNVMGEILDSYYFSQYSYQQYIDRVNEYMNALGNNVDIWEIGNEVNGEWLGNKDSVIKKIYAAYKIAKSRNVKTALTLYYNYNCWSNPQNEMFRWIHDNMPSKMKFNVDYILVSYYEDDCNNYQPNWQRVFDSLHSLFPGAKLGMGECGTSIASKKAAYINRYYTMHITTPGYIGGYFWWYYKEDCVPDTLPLWTTLDNAIGQTLNAVEINQDNIRLSVSPNPFNPATYISYTIISEAEISLDIYDVSGREVFNVNSGTQQPGSYKVRFDGSNMASGVYFCRLKAGEQVGVQKIVLVR